MKESILILLAAMMVIVLTASCARTSQPSAQDQSEPEQTEADAKSEASESVGFVYAISADPPSMDPGRCAGNETHSAFLAMHEMFVTVDQETGSVVSATAESWEVSEDGCVYIFYLREDAKWFDGQSITASHYFWFVQMFNKNVEEYNKGEV